MYPDCLCRGGESGSACILIVSVGVEEWEYMYPDCLCRGGESGSTCILIVSVGVRRVGAHVS